MPSSYFDQQQYRPTIYSRRPLYSSESTTSVLSRKRPRSNSRASDARRTPRSSQYDLSASNWSLDLESPASLVNTDYRLRGGLDTSDTWYTEAEERAQERDEEQDRRPDRFAARHEIGIPSPPATPRQADYRLNFDKTHQSSFTGWHIRSTAWALTGGLAGRIINFCWNTTFGGFQAGGGQKYGHPDEQPDKFQDDELAAHSSGSFPNTALVDFGAKAPDTGSRGGWVMVSRATELREDRSPLRKRSRASIAGGNRYASVAIPELDRTASYASPRSRPASMTSTHARTYSNHRNSPSSSRKVRTVMASPSRRQSCTTAPQPPASPISPEIASYRRQKRKDDKLQDQSLRRLNAQLQDMIREGQEALGARVEVEVLAGDDTDEGYHDQDSIWK